MLKLFARGDRRLLILLFALSLALKCGCILWTWSYDQPYRYEYDHIARNIVTGQGYTFKGHETAYMLPAYTLLSAAVMATNPSFLSYLLTELLQAILIASAIFLTYHSALHSFDRSTALLSAASVAVYPLFTAIPSQLTVENLSRSSLPFAVILSLVSCSGQHQTRHSLWWTSGSVDVGERLVHKLLKQFQAFRYNEVKMDQIFLGYALLCVHRDGLKSRDSLLKSGFNACLKSDRLRARTDLMTPRLTPTSHQQTRSPILTTW
jgi:hypothetical protein